MSNSPSFNLNSQVVDNKQSYNPSGNKLTYNFVTDPRLRRGHNFGVVYVTSSSYDNTISNNQKKSLKPINQSLKRSFNFRNKYSIDAKRNMENAKKKYNNEGFGIYTEPVTTTVMPKPISFEKIVQTDPLPEPPVPVLIWPEKTGIDVETQINDGDLFNFTLEVKPLVSIIVSKTLEDSRREVLEEEELRVMKEQQEKYKNYNEEDENRVKNIENNEKEKYDEMMKEKEDKLRRIEMTKDFQKKLYSRIKAKQYINRILKETHSYLHERGLYKTPDANDFYTDLLPDLQNIADSQFKYSFTNLDNMHKLLKYKYTKENTDGHIKSIIDEKNRLKENERIREILKIREAEEAQRRKEERARRRHEKVLDGIREVLRQELLGEAEFTEDNTPDNIFDINAYYQKDKGYTLCGGPIGQMALMFELLNKINPESEYLEEEKMNKILTTYIEKSHSFIFVYKNEDIESYKAIDDNIETIEDIIRPDDKKFEEVLQKFYENTLVNDDMLQYFFDAAKNSIGLENIQETYLKLFNMILYKFKSGSDFGVVKFAQRETAIDEIPLECICLLEPEVIPLENPADKVEDKPKSKLAMLKKKKDVKNYYNHFFSEKLYLMPFVSEKLKIICINKNFDRIWRKNFLDCIDYAYKFEEGEKDSYIEKINADYTTFVTELQNNLVQTYQKELVPFPIIIPKEEEEEEKNE